MNGFAEELAMRGYLITRLEKLLNSSFAAVVISSLLYASYHLGHGLDKMPQAIILGVIFSYFFCKFRKIWPLVLAHAMYNLVPIVLVKIFYRY